MRHTKNIAKITTMKVDATNTMASQHLTKLRNANIMLNKVNESLVDELDDEILKFMDRIKSMPEELMTIIK